LRRVTRPVVGLRAEVVEGPDVGKIAEAKGDSLSVSTAEDNDLVLTDASVSRYHLELRRNSGTIVVDDLRSTNGTWVGPRGRGARIGRATLDPGIILALGSSKLRVDDGGVLELDAMDGEGWQGILGRSPTMRTLMARIEQAAETSATVLIQGETGSGKELVARALHDASPRKSGPFETVDCGALLPSLVNSELFGHEAGAFTGAAGRHIGAFERARGGTVFLDEIGELSKEIQTTLLGVLERRSLRRLGGSDALPVDVRVVAATNRDLRAEVNQGNFRQDLYYRLAVVTLRVPPLRERPEDIGLLVQSFAAECSPGSPTESIFPPPVIDGMKLQPWPGNVRELRNFVEAACALGEVPPLAKGDRLGISALLELAEINRADYHALRGQLLNDFEEKYFAELLRLSKGNVSAAARLAGLSRTHVNEILKRRSIQAGKADGS
jgi:DNA-binding NtrC family response regulator